jgi:hypothetical protein
VGHNFQTENLFAFRNDFSGVVDEDAKTVITGLDDFGKVKFIIRSANFFSLDWTRNLCAVSIPKYKDDFDFSRDFRRFYLKDNK